VIGAPPFVGVAVTAYEVIGLPPFDAGAWNVTVACALPADAVTFSGADGGEQGVPAADIAGPVPTEFAAVTEKVYPVPFVRLVTIMGLAVPVTVTGEPPPAGDAVTVYEVTGLPPSEDGGEKETVASPFPTETLTF
jgi:hypothetical protein